MTGIRSLFEISIIQSIAKLVFYPSINTLNMRITTAKFISSFADVAKCPQDNLPEFAFIGRSNVGKSSLVNMITGQRALAHTSAAPGKTQTINHYLINEEWYLVDLPGYGYAKVSKSLRSGFGKIIDNYLLKREALTLLFVLIDSRLEPQKIDLEFLQWAGENEVPIAIIFTKADKLTRNELGKSMAAYKKELLETWEELPPHFISSATTKAGREEILDFIQSSIDLTEDQ